MKRIDYSKINVEDFLNELGVRNVFRDGPEIRYSCPFDGHNHGDANPSASMRISDTVYHCFGCGASGNALTFLCEYEGISPIEAASRLRTITGDWVREIDGDFYTTIKDALLSEKEVKVRVNPTMDDLKSRAVSWPDVFTAIENGEDVPECFRYMFDRGFAWQILEWFDIGWDQISQRITIPYFSDDDQELLGFKARTPYPDVVPRYKVLGGLEYGFDTFDVSKTLFALNKTHPTNRLIVCEGELNCISMWHKGFENVVSISGQFMSREQVYLIRRYANEVLLIFDETEKAMKAAEELIYHLPVYIVEEHDDDPADLNVLQLRELVGSAKSAIL